MSILIKGMEMPKNCDKCPFGKEKKLDVGVVCTLLNVSFDVLRRPAKLCPLIELPPHGDLIDRRYAIATTCSGRIRTLPTTEDGEDWIRVEEVRESIKAAPTIVESEE